MIDLPSVKLFGVKYPFLFGMGALLAYKRKYGDMSTGELMLNMQDLPPEKYDWLIYNAIRTGANVAGKLFIIPFWAYKLYVRVFPGFYDTLDRVLAEQLPQVDEKKKATQAKK
jgi:hypothetical protein